MTTGKTRLRWIKSPEGVEADVRRLWGDYSRQHYADPAEVVDDVFGDILDYLVGFYNLHASWTEPVADDARTHDI